MSTREPDGWYVVYSRGGTTVAGPFSTEQDAKTAKRAFQSASGRFFDIEYRDPTPAVVLPDTPTLGWVEVDGERDTMPGLWQRHDSAFDQSVSAIQWERDLRIEHVTGFREAVAVPKAEYDALVAALGRLDLNAMMAAADTISAARRLLAAVDAAGEGK